jgi:hypothetical protein
MFLLLGWAIRMGRPGLPEREPRRGGRSMYPIRGKRRVVQTIPLLKEHTNTPIGTQPDCPRESREDRSSLPKILPGGQQSSPRIGNLVPPPSGHVPGQVRKEPAERGMQVAGGYPKASLAFPPLRAFGSEGLKASLRQTEIPPFGGIRHRGPWPPDLTNISWPPSIRLISAAMGPNSFPAEFAGLGSEGVLPPGRFSPDRIPPGTIPKARNNSGEVVPGEILKRPHRDQMILAPVNSPVGMRS